MALAFSLFVWGLVLVWQQAGQDWLLVTGNYICLLLYGSSMMRRTRNTARFDSVQVEEQEDL